MSDRITNKWTPTLEEAFGDNPNVSLGRKGELAMLNTMSSWPKYTTKDHESSYEDQKAGIDISVQHESWARPYTIDVKTGQS